MAKEMQPTGDAAVGLVQKVLSLVDDGLGPLEGARAYADAKVARYGDDVDGAISRVVAETTTIAGGVGFALGFGGLPVMVATVPGDITAQIFLNVRMVLTIARLRGWDTSDESVRMAALLTAAGAAPEKALAEFGVKVGTKAAAGALQRLPVTVIREINKRVGFTLLAKYGTKRSMITLAKAIPVAGAVVGGAVDAGFVPVVATLAKASFPAQPDGDGAALAAQVS